MKRALLLSGAVIIAVAMLGCTPQQEPQDVPPPPKAPVAAAKEAKEIVTDYATGLTNSVDKARGVNSKAQLDAVDQAIKSYYFENERYPASLDEISGYLPQGTDAGMFDYDPATGKVALR